MCQITVSNLHSALLNRKFYLLAGSIGSTVHDDGWGFVESSKKIVKWGLALYYTTNSGQVLAQNLKSTGVFVGHVRQASPQVPVCDDNSHPFLLEGISFVHNGKLTPKEPEKFVLEEDGETWNATKKEFEPGKVKRSDSLVFFEEFIKDWQAIASENLSQNDRFVKALNTTMEKFYGKFAMVFVINGSTYIVRGRTADLHVSYLLENDVKENPAQIGWVVNTDKKLTEVASLLLSNLEQLDGRPPLRFSIPASLAEETIYLAEPSQLITLGKVKENIAPVTTYYSSGRVAGAGNFTGTTSGKTQNTTGNSDTKTRLEILTEMVFKFITDYSLSLGDLQNLFYITYEIGIPEVTEPILEHFCEEIIPLLRNQTSKAIRKQVKKKTAGFVPMFKYTQDVQYPWLMNPRNLQLKVVEDSGTTKSN